MTQTQYQLFPALTTEEYQALKDDIAKRGVMVPVEYDEAGHILDGHHRVRACQELGIPVWPRITREGWTEEQKTAHVLALNLDRRHLTREQRAALVAKLRGQGWSTRRIADRLGVSVGTAHNDLQVFKNEHLEPQAITGTDGKEYPAQRRPMLATSEALPFTDSAAEDEEDEPDLENMRVCSNCIHFQNDTEVGWCSLHQRRVPFGDSILDGWTACNLEDFVNENDPQPEPEEAPRNVHFMSESVECYTPREVLDRVIAAMGAIDLDPCSNSHESPNVPAAEHFTQEDDGLAQLWRGRVFMNPPYGRELDDWIAKLCGEYEAGRVTEAVALVPSRTDTQWFRRLRAYPRCFLWGRLRFVNQENSAPFPSMAVYLGLHLASFIRSFADIGDTYTLTNDDNIPVR